MNAARGSIARGSLMPSGILRLLVPASLLAGLLLGSPVHHARAETAENLLADPRRLDLVQAGCKAGTAWTTSEPCNEVAQAIRMRFQGGDVPYAPHTVDLFPTRPTMSTPAPSSAAPPAVPKARSKPRSRVHRLARADAKSWR